MPDRDGLATTCEKAEQQDSGRDQDLDELSNQANDLIRAQCRSEAEAACRELLDRFPDEIDGHWRSYECFKAKGDFQSAMPHARATLEMAEEGGASIPGSLPGSRRISPASSMPSLPKPRATDLRH